MVLAEVHILDPFSSFCAGCPSAKATCTEQVGRLAAHIWRQWFHVVFLRPIGVHFTRSTLPTCPRHKHKQLVVGFFGIHFMLNTFALTLVDLVIASMDFSPWEGLTAVPTRLGPPQLGKNSIGFFPGFGDTF